jgi:flagellar hook-length control protein FliK
MLPAPRGRRANEVKAAFVRLGNTGPMSPSDSIEAVPCSGAGPSRIIRQYPIALSKVARSNDESCFCGEAIEEEATAESEEQSGSALLRVTSEEPLPPRPPPGVPMVRPSVPAPCLSDEVQVLPESLAQAATIANNPDGSTVFTVSLELDDLGPLRCQIAFHHGEVEATFLAADVNLRRLLEAEAPRLRNALEARGLKASAVRVELSAPDS